MARKASKSKRSSQGKSSRSQEHGGTISQAVHRIWEKVSNITDTVKDELTAPVHAKKLPVVRTRSAKKATMVKPARAKARTSTRKSAAAARSGRASSRRSTASRGKSVRAGS